MVVISRTQRIHQDLVTNLAVANFWSLLPKQQGLLRFVPTCSGEVIFSTETWLSPSIYNPKLTSSGAFTIYGKYSPWLITPVNQTRTALEMVWITLRLKCKTFLVRVSERPPGSPVCSSIDNFNDVLAHIQNKLPSPIIVAADLNYPWID